MYSVLLVIPKATDLVTAAIAETKTTGSNYATIEPPLKVASGFPSYVCMSLYPSAKKIEVILPLSANFANQI